MKNRDISRWLTSLETLRHFRKIALRLGIFLAMFRECLCVVARQLAPKGHNFSNVAKLARQCKWPLSSSLPLFVNIDSCMNKLRLYNPNHLCIMNMYTMYLKFYVCSNDVGGFVKGY